MIGGGVLLACAGILYLAGGLSSLLTTHNGFGHRGLMH